MAAYDLTGIVLKSGRTAMATATEAITAGDCVYKDTTDSVGLASSAGAGDGTKISTIGIALASAAIGDPCIYATNNSIVECAGTGASVGSLSFLLDTGHTGPGSDLSVGNNDWRVITLVALGAGADEFIFQPTYDVRVYL